MSCRIGLVNGFVIDAIDDYKTMRSALLTCLGSPMRAPLLRVSTQQAPTAPREEWTIAAAQVAYILEVRK